MEDKTTKLWKEYQDGISYQTATDMRNKIPLFVRFYEGKQWAESTEDTKNLPRPVINEIKMIVRSKKASILSYESKITYRSYDDSDMEKFNHFADYQSKKMNLDKLESKATQDAAIKGNWIIHFFWNKDLISNIGKISGGIDAEVIDPLHIFVSNPNEANIQKQESIIISSREPLKSVLKRCDPSLGSDIKADSEENNAYGITEQESTSLVTVLTRYFRKGKEVFCEIGTRTGMVRKEFLITPDINKALQTIQGEAFTPEEKKYVATLYPIAFEQYEPKEGSIYGIGEVEGLIMNQKSINFTLAMSLLNIQNNAWGKYITVPGALKQKITNKPGEVLTDYSGTGNGIRKMTEQGLQTYPLTLIDSIVNLNRSMTGATEVMTGETVSSSMSGAAISALQNQAQAPIAELRDSFWNFKEQIGAILVQFYKLYYTDISFAYKDTNNNVVNDTFSSRDYEDKDIETAVEVISGSKASTAGNIAMLETLLRVGAIDSKAFVSLYPEDAISNKSSLIEELNKSEENKQSSLSATNNQLSAENTQYKAYIEQLAKTLESYKSTIQNVQTIVNKNESLEKDIAELKATYIERIKQANSEIIKSNEAIQNLTTTDAGKKILELTQDNKILAQELLNRGIN